MLMVDHIYLQQSNLQNKVFRVSNYSEEFKLNCIKEAEFLTPKQEAKLCIQKGLHPQSIYRFKNQLKEGKLIDPKKYMIHKISDRFKHD